MSSNALRNSNSALGAFFRRISSRLGAAKAVTAGAHKLAVVLYNMLKNGSEYLEAGAEYYEEKYRDRCVRNLERKAAKLGYEMRPLPIS